MSYLSSLLLACHQISRLYGVIKGQTDTSPVYLLLHSKLPGTVWVHLGHVACSCQLYTLRSAMLLSYYSTVSNVEITVNMCVEEYIEDLT